MHGYSISDWRKASQAFGIISILAIACAGCCLGLVIMTKKGILLFGAIAATFMSRMYIVIYFLECPYAIREGGGGLLQCG